MQGLTHRTPVVRLPLRSREETQVLEEIDQHRNLLNESWSHYCSRSLAGSSTVRVKDATETWDAFTKRKARQRSYFELHDQLVRSETARVNEDERASNARSRSVIEKLMEFERRQQGNRLPAQNTLYVNCKEHQQRVFYNERRAVEVAESLLRNKIATLYDESLFLYVSGWHANSQLQRVRDEERVAEERAVLEKKKLQRQRDAIAEKEREAERMAREQQDAENEKERVEAEKRLERKRREEERRAKARAEREQKKGHQTGNEN